MRYRAVLGWLSIASRCSISCCSESLSLSFFFSFPLLFSKCLINPLEANVRLMGVHSSSLTEPLARVLKNLGVRSAFVVWGEDGLDEISINARTRITELKEGKIKTYYIRPEDFAMARASLQEIRGGDREENAHILKDILGGEKGAKRDIVLINSAVCLVAAQRARNLKEGIEIAKDSIDSGKADGKLESLVEFTNS